MDYSEVKTSARSASIKNGLSIRIGHKISSTIPTGENQSEHAEWWIEQDLPTGETVDEVQDVLERQLQARRDKWKTKVAESVRSASKSTSVSTSPPPDPALESPQTKPSQRSPPVATTQKIVRPDPVALEGSSGWKTHSTGKGEWTKAIEQSVLREYLLTCRDKTAVLGNFRYKLWGSNDHMLSRWRHAGGSS